jgi:hypothetical protein
MLRIRKFQLVLGILGFVAAGAGCGGATPSTQNTVNIDPTFQPYVDRFVQTSTTNGTPVAITSLAVQFGVMDTSQERGLCEIDANAVPTITVDQAAWDVADDPAHESLLFHELGHCVLRRLHLPTVEDNGTPASLMYPYTMQDSVYLSNQDGFKKELFSIQNQF